MRPETAFFLVFAMRDCSMEDARDVAAAKANLNFVGMDIFFFSLSCCHACFRNASSLSDTLVLPFSLFLSRFFSFSSRFLSFPLPFCLCCIREVLAVLSTVQVSDFVFRAPPWLLAFNILSSRSCDVHNGHHQVTRWGAGKFS